MVRTVSHPGDFVYYMQRFFHRVEATSTFGNTDEPYDRLCLLGSVLI